MQTSPSPRFRPCHWLILPLLAALALAGAILPAAAASVATDEPALTPLVPPDFDPSQHGLSSRPLIVPSLGLAMYIPDATVLTDRAAGNLIVTVSESAPSPAWSLTIQHLHSTAAATPEDQIAQHLAGLKAANREFEVLENRPFTVGEAQGRLCYIQQTVQNVFGNSDTIISGWLILPASPEVSLVISILATPEAMPFMRSSLLASFSTIKMRSAVELSLERRSHMDAGRAFLASLTPDRLRSLLGTHQWARIYASDASGRERELGYSLLEVYEARRGELDPDRPESSYTLADREHGLMVRLQGRIIGDAERRIFYDSIALYWLAWDQSEEAWSVRGTQRQGRAERSEAETGIRLKPSVSQPRERVRVTRLRSGDYESTPYEWALPDVYLSQALATVLGRLLATGPEEPCELSYYFYNYSHAVPQLTRRQDRWEPARDGSGNWTLTTRLSADSAPVVSTYSRSGQLVQTQRPDGTLTVPTTIERIRQLWMRQGLPMGD